MSSTGVRIASQAASLGTKNRSPLAQLLHALNQPLTGLQCSLELAVAGPRRIDQHVQTLREGLDLTSRMRALVEAIREVNDFRESTPGSETTLLDALLRETAADLHPVAQQRNVRLVLHAHAPLPVQGTTAQLASLAFRLLESILSLTREGGVLELLAENDRTHARLEISWSSGAPDAHSPLSPPELGLLVAQAGWEQQGAEWIQSQADLMQRCSIRVPLAGVGQDHTAGAGI